MSVISKLMALGASGSGSAGFTIDLTVSGQFGTNYNTWTSNTITGADSGIGSWVAFGSGYFYSFLIPEDAAIAVEVGQAEGSCGNGHSLAGNGYRINGTINVPANRYLFLLAGNCGYLTNASVSSDGTSGGGGGATQVLISDPSGPITIGGMSATLILVANGTGGGNDATYQGRSLQGTSYPNLASSSGWSVYSGNGVTYTRTATAYGGFPNGNVQDDSGSNGGGPLTNYYDPTYISSQSITFSYTGTNTTSGQHAGYISLTL